MLSLLTRLGLPVVLALGLAGGGAVTGGISYLFTTFFHDPQLVSQTRKEDEAQCTIRTQQAAENARVAERARRDAATEAALSAYIEAKASEDAAQQALIDQQASENSSYEQALQDSGRSCPAFDDGDFSRLRQ